MIAVIGGTSGIGLEAGIYLQSLGFEIVVGGRHNPQHNEIRFISLDVTNEVSVEEFFSELPTLDGLIYATGITAKKKPITEYDSSVFNDLMQTNVNGLLLCLKYAYPKLVESQGRVVVVNSLASRISSKFSGIEYTISKSALSGVVKQLALDFAPDNVLINSIFPSMTATPMLIANVKKSDLDSMAEGIPIKRIATPLEIAKGIAFLISKDNTYMTGGGLDLNGGQFLSG